MKRFTLVGAVLAAAVGVPFAAFAQYPHPHYLEAIRDLRFARAVLMPGDRGPGWGPVVMDQRRAFTEIDRAIVELRQAAEMDGRNPNDVPPVDMRWEPRDRLRRASEALAHARGAIAQEEINPRARLVRDRAFHHVDEAQRAVHHAMETWH